MFDKEFFPLSLRVQIPAATLPAAPYGIDIHPGVDHLGYIEFQTATPAIVQDVGVRILSNGLQIYPAQGSMIDASAGLAGCDDFGVLPSSGQRLKIPFFKKLRGSQNTLSFEFYSQGAAVVAVNVLIATYSEVRAKVAEEKRNDADAK